MDARLDSKDWIKHFWASCKEKPDTHDLWSRVSEMVGYLSGEEGRGTVLPVGADCTLRPLGPSGGGSAAEPPSPDEPAPVRRVVCSPDLPPVVFSGTTPAAQPAPADSSTAEASSSAPFQCGTCQKSFTGRSAYTSHIKTHHKEGAGASGAAGADDPYQCNFCGKTFAVPARLTRHYRTHTGEKPYQCEYCSKSFSVKENLSVHRRIHTKERPYKCDICQRAFEHSGKLHRHMRIHTGERPHKCSVCNKTFIQSGQLVIHMRTHTGEKPYVCKDCGKGFTCSKQLKVHYRTHSGEKPYSCDICGKSFGYNHVLKLHQVAHYGEKVYKCTICNQTFSSKKTMESHIKSHSESAKGDDALNAPVTEMDTASSSSSDKENLATAASSSPSTSDAAAADERQSSNQTSTSYPNIRELCGYLYKSEEKPTSGGLNPALLAAVAVASGESAGPEYRPSPDHVLETPAGFVVSEPPVYLVPEPVASLQRRQTAYPDGEELLELPELVVVEETIEEERSDEDEMEVDDDDCDPLLTPPSSNPVSPASNYLLPLAGSCLVESAAEEPAVDERIREALILPPRKRSKAILKSMETERVSAANRAIRAAAPVRYSSVIQYAKAS
ncbi:Kruppel-like protein 1 [Nesidiocoris tenuis]|uniref:Kruppel-like protein 1 n=1 Tax=Nesidiocoris tenuis TaxID=355587 RepID=A0ABN7AA84_9HEMI|nr:Kruppel-like protein 1 [Nesidiocoris tenuis]